jgi:hypothetical protein
MTVVTMKRISKNRWRIESSSGNVLLDDIILGTVAEAEEYVKAYVSTWGWEYKLET